MAGPTAPTAGSAVFSSRCGKYAQRPAYPNMLVAIRTDPNLDRDVIAAKWQQEYPDICKGITTLSPLVEDYFDSYDQEFQGYEFLRAVLRHIAEGNISRSKEIQEYAQRWVSCNSQAFLMLQPEHTADQMFVSDDIDCYGRDFIDEAFVQIMKLKNKALYEGEFSLSR